MPRMNRVGPVVLLALASRLMAQGLELADGGSITTIRIVGPTQSPIPEAEGFLILDDEGGSFLQQWLHADEFGEINIDHSHLSAADVENETTKAVRMVVRAPGYSFTVVPITLPLQNKTVTTKLNEGRVIALKLESEAGTIPDDLIVSAFVPGLSVTSWFVNVDARRGLSNMDVDELPMFSAPVITRLGPGRYVFRVPTEERELYLLFHRAGFIRGYQVGPYDVSDPALRHIEITIPRPAKLRVHAGPSTELPAAYASCALSIMPTPDLPDGAWWFRGWTRRFDAKSFDVIADDLAPGKYMIWAQTGTHGAGDYSAESQNVELESDVLTTVSRELSTFDEEVLRKQLSGDHTLLVRLNGPSAKSAIGSTYELRYWFGQYERSIPMQSGRVPESLEIRFENLPVNAAADPYLYLDGRNVARVFFGDEPDTHEHAVAVHLTPKVGQLAPDVSMTNLESGNVRSLSDFRGQVVLLDFWASWCGPCQAPMAENESLAARHNEDWAGRVVIVGLSIDKDIATIRDHVARKGFAHVSQAFAHRDPSGANAADAFGIQTIPHAFLIDTDGTILWEGNPAGVDIEAKIESALPPPSGPSH